MTDRWTERLSEYLDGELSTAERTACERHLAACAECRLLLEELRAVVARAAALDDRPPAHDLWAGIAGQMQGGGSPRDEARVLDLGARRPRRRITFSVPQLAAAGLAAVAIGVGGAWAGFAGLATGGPAVTAAAAGPGHPLVRAVTADYDLAIADLQRVLDEFAERLDPSTVRVLEENLATIDRAIAEARAALEADPANTYLSGHLVATMRQKVDLLRRAAELVSAAS